MMIYAWRSKSRDVAIADLIGTVVFYAVFLAMMTYHFDIKFLNSIGVSSVNLEQEQVAAGVFWMAFGILTGCSITQLWISYFLLKTTRLIMDIFEALRIVAVWRLFTFGFIFVQVACDIVCGLYVHLIFVLLVRGTFLYVVSKFYEELEEDLESEMRGE